MMSVASSVSVSVIMHMDGDLLDDLNGHLLDGGNGHLDLLDDGDVVLHWVLLHDRNVDGFVHGVGRVHDQGHLVLDVLAHTGAEAASRASSTTESTMSISMSTTMSMSTREGGGNSGHCSDQEYQRKRVHDCERGGCCIADR